MGCDRDQEEAASGATGAPATVIASGIPNRAPGLAGLAAVRRSHGAALALVVACCRPLADPARPDAVRRAALSVDWVAVVALVQRHRVAGLVVRALQDAKVAAPTQAAARLAAAAARGTGRSLRLAAETVRLQSALDACGVNNLALKGAALDHFAWGGFGLKESFDIDLLVAPEDARPAVQRLQALGYHPLDAPSWPGDDPEAWSAWVARQKDLVLRGPGADGAVVELHWRAVETFGLARGIGLGSPTRMARLSPGLAIRTLAADDTFAHLCAHGAAHGWARLKWLADVAQLLSPLSPQGRAALRGRALELGAGRCVDLAFTLAERLLGVPAPERPPPGLADRLLLALSLHAIAARRDPEETLLLRDLVSLSRLLHPLGPGALGGELARLWDSPRDRRLLGLPRPLAGLRHPARLPLWLWRRIRNGLAGRRAGSL